MQQSFRGVFAAGVMALFILQIALVSAQQLDIISARMFPLDNRAGATSTYRFAARWEPSVIAGDFLLIEFPPGTTFGSPVTLTFPNNFGTVTCTPSPATYNISCPVQNPYTASDEEMPITNIINAPYEIAAMSTLRVHVNRLSQTYAFNSMTFPQIVFGPISRFLLTPSQVTGGFTTTYLVNVNIFQRPNVNDRIVIGFPEGTSRLLNSPVAVSLNNDNRMTFRDCMVNEIALPEVRCRVDTIDPSITTGTFITYFVQNLRHGTNSTRAMATNLRYSVLPANAADITASAARRDANITGGLTVRLADPCKAGEYTPNFNGTCFRCPRGNISTAESSQFCTPCSAGRFANAEGMTQCEDCDIGRFQNETGKSACNACGRGKFAGIKSRTFCDDCEAGTELNAEGGSKCTDCPLNTFAANNGTAVCSACATGSATNTTKSTSCDFCVSGRFKNNETLACDQCVRGKFSDGLSSRTVCKDCDIGWVSSVGAVICTQCAAGKIAPALGTPECIDCEPGKAVGAPGQGKCDNCTQGFEGPTPGMLICAECTAGKFSLDGAVNCTLCPLGSVSGFPRAFQCDICAAGEYIDQPGQAACLPCTAGKFQNMTNSTRCDDCDLGRFARGSRTQTCSPCDPGYYMNRTGAAQCDLCEPGLKSPEPGNVQCRFIPDGCEPGRFTVFNATTGNDTCVECQVGRFNAGYNVTACTECPLGKFQPFIKSEFCYNCTAGNYTPRVGMVYCDLCPLGRYSTVNESFFCHQCLPGQSTIVAGMTRCDNCPVGTIAPVIGTPVCVNCQIGKYNPATGSTSCTNCPLRTSTPTEGAFKLSSCQSVACPRITTSDPNLKITYTLSQTVQSLFGSQAPSPEDLNRFTVGSTARLSCLNNFTLVGPDSRTCLAPVSRPTFTSGTGGVESGSSNSNATDGLWTGSNPSCVLKANYNLTAVPVALAFNVNPASSVRAGEAWTSYLQVILVDDKGLPTPAASAQIRLELDTSTATGMSTASGPVASGTIDAATSVAGGVRLLGQLVRDTVNGVAVFPGLSLNALGTNFRVVAYSSTNVVRGNSTYFNVVPNEATRLTITTPIRAIADELFTTDVVVTVTDPVGFWRNHTTNITLGIDDSEFWFSPGGVGSTRTILATSGTATFTGIRIATSRVLGANSGYFVFYAIAPELEKGYSVRVQLFSNVANNNIRRMQEFVYPLVFNMTLKTTDEVWRGVAIYRTNFVSALKTDLCNSLRLTTAGCKRLRVTHITPTNQTTFTNLDLLGSTGNSLTYSTERNKTVVATIQIDPPVGLSSATINRMVVAGGAGGQVPQPGHGGSSQSLFSASEAELLAMSGSSTACYNGVCSTISPELLASTNADAATPYELISQATSLLATPSSSIFQGSASSQAVLSSAALDITGRLVQPTEESMNGGSSSSSSEALHTSDNFIIGMTVGLGLGGILVIVLVVICCRKSGEKHPTETEDLRPAQAKNVKPPVKRTQHPASATMSKYSTAKPKGAGQRGKLNPSSSFNV